MALFPLPSCYIGTYIFNLKKDYSHQYIKICKDKLKKRLNDYLDGCKTCGLPCLLDKGTTCNQSSLGKAQEECYIWKKYKTRIKPIIV